MGATNRQSGDQRLIDVSKGEAILAFYVGVREPATAFVHSYKAHLQTIYGGLTPAEYRSAQVAIAKAFRRLEDRGLAVRTYKGGGSGIDLTESGLAEAQRLTLSHAGLMLADRTIDAL